MNFRPLPLAAAIVSALASLSAMANEADTELPAVEVASEAAVPYKATTVSSPKLTRPLLDTPQTVNVVPQALLEEQGVQSLRDALRNVTGISIQAGEGNPPSGDQLKIRGFSARDDIYVDGIRDVGNYFRDPFNVEQIEVTKGPASAYAGRGSTGGTINMVSKAPKLETIRTVELTAGTDATKRIALDINTPLESVANAAFRLGVMSHDAEVAGRDHVENHRVGIAPSLAFGIGTDTRLTLSYLHMSQDNRTDGGIPNGRNPSLAGSGFEGKPAPVATSNFYGYRNDYQDLTADQATVKIEHDVNESLSLRNQTRWGRTHNDSIFSSPRFTPGGLTTIDATTQVVGNRKPRDQVDTLLANQSDLTFKFDTGALRHTLVTGAEISKQHSENRRRLDVNGPATNLLNPVYQDAPNIPYHGTSAELTTEQFGIYLFDTIKISDQWEVNGGLRWDEVKSEVQGHDSTGNFAAYEQRFSKTDREPSSSLGLVFKPMPNASLYAGWGTSFVTSGVADVVQLAGTGTNATAITNPGSFGADPEKSESTELGMKLELLDNRLALNAAIFRITKTDARTPGGPGEPSVVLDGEQEIEGAELSVSGKVTPDWNLFAGYTYMDGKITRSNTA
ncbi:MAG: TonB-dependent siderophore receptor, partial [Moraxellaceae bacterium]|nr:TonB-dependent siderophore receptor [Moraxellaceae bacterium]